MKKKFSKKYILKNSGCYEPGKVLELWPEGVKSITLDDILSSSIPLEDKYWIVCRKLLTSRENAKLAIGVAEIVLHLFENEYPEDDICRESIIAAKKVLKTNKYTDSFLPAYFSYSARLAYFSARSAYLANYYASNYYASSYAVRSVYFAYSAAIEKNDNSSIKSLEKHLIDFCK